MLVLSRKVGEKIVLGNNIAVTVVAVRGKVVRLGFEAPPNVIIRRQEICFDREPVTGEMPFEAHLCPSLGPVPQGTC